MKFDRKTTFPVIDVVAAALAAYSDTNGEIVRATYTTRENGVEKTVMCNRDLALQYLASPEKLEPYREQAEEDIQFFQHQALMATLVGKQNTGFINAITEAITTQNVILGNVGLIVWMPKMLANMRKREDNRLTWIEYANHSHFIPAKEKERVTVDFTLVEKRYIHDKSIWVAIGTTPEGYVISYFSNTEKKVITNGRISGKVKSFRVDNYRNSAKVTNLNYVKVLE